MQRLELLDPEHVEVAHVVPDRPSVRHAPLPSIRAGGWGLAYAASSCSTRCLSASACGRAATVKNVLKRSSTCESPRSAGTAAGTVAGVAQGQPDLGLLDELRELFDRLACAAAVRRGTAGTRGTHGTHRS
jgi:hypothetical protein